MQTKLFKPTFAFGVLVAFVLALGVQGTAEAITKFTRGSGDLRLYKVGEDFKISFSVSLQSQVKIPSSDPVSYHYDDESINIAVENANITKVGSRAIYCCLFTYYE